VLPAIGDLLGAVKRFDDSAAAAAELPLRDTPGELLALGARAAVAAKDLAGSMLCKTTQEQRGDVVIQVERPADGALAGVDDGALLGVDAAAAEELATRAPGRDEKAVREAFCLITG
jgi:hypothetical protein